MVTVTGIQSVSVLTLAGLGAATHAVVHLQLALQGVHELPALTQLLLQEGHLVLQPREHRDTRVRGQWRSEVTVEEVSGHKPRTDQDFFSPRLYFWLRPRISAPCRHVRTTGKSERLTD